MAWTRVPPQAATAPGAWAAGALAWAAGWAAMLGLDTHLDLAHQALLLLMAGVLATLWWPAWAALAAGALAVLGFNLLLVPPRGSLAVQRWQDGLLMALMAATLALGAGLVQRLRRQAMQARQHQRQAEQLRQLGEALRDAAAPAAHAGALAAALGDLLGAPAALLLCQRWPPDADAVLALGETNADEAAGLWHCLRQGQAMGPGTPHHRGLAHWYLPLRGGSSTVGAAVLRLPAAGRGDEALRSHAQALCDQMGVALQRRFSDQAAQAAAAQAQGQAVRNALLAAISHDYRTPLATILGAASSLHDQGDRLGAGQRQALAARIVHEVQHLGRLTDNTLQLARLDAPGVVLRRDWESAEELVGTALRRARQRAPGRALRARLEPGLPLLHGDALLLTQLLDNLVDNALKHTPDDAPVEILARRGSLPPGATAPQPDGVVLAVRDRGPGVAPAWRERIFEVFQRGDDLPRNAADGAAPAGGRLRPGAGVGLAVCRAIARAHGGELRLRGRAHGGSAFECHLPAAPQPAAEAGTPDDSTGP